MIWRLTEDPSLFPDPRQGEEDGLIAVGGDLSPERLIAAYNNGIFPWYGFRENEDILWWCPMKRFVIFPKEIHISHSMRQLLKKGRYLVSINQAFDQVIEHCSTVAQRNEQRGAWLGDDMKQAYKRLFDMGLAASIEVWDTEKRTPDDPYAPGALVGGLYGVNIGCNFFGESMFSLVPSASKIALIFLANQLEDMGGIIDCQFETAHLKSMGGRYISYDEYMDILIGSQEKDIIAQAYLPDGIREYNDCMA